MGGGILILLLILYVLNQFLGKENFYQFSNLQQNLRQTTDTLKKKIEDCNKNPARIFTNSSCRNINSLNNKECNDNNLIFEKGFCRALNPKKVSECTSKLLVQNKEKTKCIPPQSIEECNKFPTKKIYTNSSCRDIILLNEKECNDNKLIFENGVCRAVNPKNLSDCTSRLLVPNKEKTKCISPQNIQDCYVLSPLKLLLPNIEKTECVPPKSIQDCRLFSNAIYTYNYVKNNNHTGCYLQSNNCTKKNSKLYHKNDEPESCCRNLYDGEQFCKLGKDLSELDKIAFNTDNKTIKNFGGNENDYCNSNNHCNDKFYCNKEFNKCLKKGTSKENEACDNDDVCDSSYYCNETSKKCIRGTGKSSTYCTRDGNCDINYDCKTFSSSNGFGPDEIVSKCILDYEKFCKANNRTYGKFYSDSTYKKIDPKNNPTNIHELNYCDETESEKKERVEKERCIDGKYNGPGKYDNYVEPKRAVCERHVKINYDDIRTPSPTADSYRSCMNERNCERYNFVKGW